MPVHTRPSGSPPQLVFRGMRFIRHLPNFIRMYWRLLWDRRVSIWPKTVLVLSFLYVLSPLDFIPDFVPFVGGVDDLLVIIMACRFFIYLCPPEVLQEHVHQIDAELS